jgi:hypothetical protein
LHRTAQNIAAQTVRTEVRRRAREQEAAAMNELLATESDASWDQLAPQLDAALGELSEGDRDALMLRYFERKSAREMAQTLGISDEAAQKRVNRAVDRLREGFAKRGVAVGASGLVLVLTANAVQAAPAGLAVAISASAALVGTTLTTTATSATLTTIKAIAMTTLQKTVITITIAAAIGTGVYQARQASTLRRQVQVLQQEQAPAAAQLTQLQAENERLSNLVAQASAPQSLPQAQLNELLKLRGKANLASTGSRELAHAKATLARQAGAMAFLTNAMGTGVSTVDQWKLKDAAARLSRMQKQLNLSDEQSQAVGSIMTNHIQRQSALLLAMMTGKLTPEQQQAEAAAIGDLDSEIKALLAPDQQAAYPQYLQAEKTNAADRSARSDAETIAKGFKLPKAQQEQLRPLLYEANLKEPAGAFNQQAITQARNSGNLADAANLSVELQRWQLGEKLKVLEGFLTPEQMHTYRQQQMDRINQLAAAMKLLGPQKAAAGTP